jgi:nitroimidazol reductase NimA-like FMN-containing flavoprotein (pyridoxamine 5'-phosphate oxidase superfamily)
MTPEHDNRTIRQKPQRAVSDFEEICRILDQGYVAHVGFFDPEANEYLVIPVGYVRDGARLLFHGQSGSRLFRTLHQGVKVCATVTLLDGIVIARTPLNSSMNYQSVMAFGDSYAIEGDEKVRALITISNRLIPGLWDASRELTSKEIASTAVVGLDLDDVTAKRRAGGALDLDDTNGDVWAGHLPIDVRFGTLVPNEEATDLAVPDYAENLARTPLRSASI